jgi:hypothetical protein
LTALLTATLVLPIGCMLLAAVGALLRMMGDSAGAAALGWIAFALGAVWLLGFVALVLSIAINGLVDPDDLPPNP